MNQVNNDKPRKFYLSSVDLDFDLNCKKILACEYPHKDYDLSLFTKVIEYTAYEELKNENERLIKLLSEKQDSLNRINNMYGKEF